MLAKNNPFSVERIRAIRYRFLSGSWAEFLTLLEANRYRGAIVGPEGSGKTTLLEDLAPVLASKGLHPRVVRLSRGREIDTRELFEWLGVPRKDQVMLVDGAEQLGLWSWWLLTRRCRRAGGLIVTSHRLGRLTTLVRCSTTLDLLGEIVTELADDATVPRAEVQRLYIECRGNLRDALRAMYDRCAAA